MHLDGDYLRVSLPHIDFLKGKPLDRLKDGASVAFIGQVTITTSPNSLIPIARSVARFALSYDIWEERFSVTKIGQTPDSRRSPIASLRAGDGELVPRQPGDRPFADSRPTGSSTSSSICAQKIRRISWASSATPASISRA